MAHFAVSAVGVDRPGIVAAVTGALVELGCNLEDTSMTILRGHFAMMLIVAGPDALDARVLEDALARPAAELDLVVAVRRIDDAVPPPPPGAPWAVSVYGADRPGIVHRVASVLAERQVNIVDLDTRVIGEPGSPVYAMLLDVTVPAGTDPAEVSLALEAVAAELGIECTMHPAEADVL